MMRPTLSTIALATLGALSLAAAGCRSNDGTPSVALHVEAPPPAATKAEQLPGLHNVVTYAPDLVCGGVPEGREGLETLAAMGIKTIVSVDGATPDAKTAEQLGMHYIHLPISYDTVMPERQKELAQVLANAEQPIYVHCHHGQHRSAAAIGVGLVLSGGMTPDAVEARMKVSGTSPAYEGLWTAVREAKPLPKDELVADVRSFPSQAKVSGLVAVMAEIDQVIDLVKQSRAAGWNAPDDHPDLVATKETKRLATLFANLEGDAESKLLPADYQERLQQSIALTEALDAAVRGARTDDAGQLLDSIQKGCKECHKLYRDR